MGSMKEQRRVHLGFWIAYSISQIANRPARHLNICHLLGANLRRNWTLEFEEGVELPSRCPKLELFNIDFFVRIQVLERLCDGKLRFNSKARKGRQAAQQEARREELEQTRRENRGRSADRPESSMRPPKKILELVPTTGEDPEEATRTTYEWRLCVEQMLTQLV